MGLGESIEIYGAALEMLGGWWYQNHSIIGCST